MLAPLCLLCAFWAVAGEEKICVGEACTNVRAWTEGDEGLGMLQMQSSSRTSDDELTSGEDQVAQEEQDEVDDDMDGERAKAKNIKYYKPFTLKSTKSNQYMEPGFCAGGGGGGPCTSPTGDDDDCKSSQLAMLPLPGGKKGKIASGTMMSIQFYGCRVCPKNPHRKRIHLGGFFSGRKVFTRTAAGGNEGSFTILHYDNPDSTDFIADGDEVMLQWADLKNAPDVKLTVGTKAGGVCAGAGKAGTPESFYLYSKKDMKLDPTSKERTKFIIELA